MKSLVWALIQYDRCPNKKQRSGHGHAQREDHVTQGDDGHLLSKERSSQESSRARTLTSDFQVPEM